MGACSNRDEPGPTIDPPGELVVRPSLLCELPYGEWERTEQTLADDVATYAVAGADVLLLGFRRHEDASRPMEVLWMTVDEGVVETESVIIEETDGLWPAAATSELGVTFVLAAHHYDDPDVVETELLRVERDGTISARASTIDIRADVDVSIALDDSHVVLVAPDGAGNTDVAVHDRELALVTEQHFPGHGMSEVQAGRDGIRLAAAEWDLGVVHVYRLVDDGFVEERVHETGPGGWVRWVDDHVSIWAGGQTLLLREDAPPLRIEPPPGAGGVVEVTGSRTPFGLVLAAKSADQTWLGVLTADDAMTDWDRVFLRAVEPRTHTEHDSVGALGIDLRPPGRPLVRVGLRCPISAPI